MRRKPLFVRTVGVGLFLLLFSSNAFFQKNEPAEKAAPEEVEKAAPARGNPFSTVRLRLRQSTEQVLLRRFGKSYARHERQLSEREISETESFSARGISFFPTGIQSLLSMATGITQTIEIPTLERFGLVSSNGQRPIFNNFTVDGMRANLGVAADEAALARGAGLLPALTASGGMNNLATTAQVSEITVKTVSSAREQRVAGAEISVSTRSGTNEFHGSLYEIFGTEKLNANDFFANSRGLRRPAARLNLFGGAVGGFFLRNALGFHAGFEGLRLRQPGFGVSEVPDFTSRQTSSGALQTLFKAYPLPNGRETSNGFAEFSASYANPVRHDVFGLRIDAQPLNSLRVGGRFNYADSRAGLRGDRDFSLNTVRNFDTETGSLSLWTVYTVNSNVVIDGRVNFSRNRIGQRFSIDDFGGADFSPALFATPFDFLKFDLAAKNSALAAGKRLATIVNQFQAVGSLDWSVNNHRLIFGASYRRLPLEIGAARTERSVLVNRAGQNPNFTTARVVELERNVPESAALDNLSLVAQEDWRVHRRLILNLGLRWDADFAPTVNAPAFAFRNATAQVRDQTGNFAPRFGAAFDLRGSGNAVLRGGAGLYFNYGNGAASEIFADSFPFAAGAFAQNAALDAAPTAPLKPLLLFADDLRTPHAWHVFAEYQQTLFSNHIVTATYVFSAGRDLYRTRTFANADPQFNYIRLTDNTAESNFNALQLRFERRFTQGFSFNARYNLSKSTDDFSHDLLRETNFTTDDFEQERGASDFDVRHQLSVYGVYDLPTFFAAGWAKRLTEDWSLSAFANARSAFPVTIGYWRAGDFGRQFVRADRVPNVPTYLPQTGARYINPDAFTISQFDRPGNSKRNSVRGFPFFQLDASLQRRIRLTGETRFELAITALNLLNKTNFADASGNLGTLLPGGQFLANGYFGRPTATFGSTNFTPFHLYGGARTIQLSVKFVF